MRVAFLSYDHGEYCIRLASAIAGASDVLLLLPAQVARPHVAKLSPAVHYQPFVKPRLRQAVAQARTVCNIVGWIRRVLE